MSWTGECECRYETLCTRPLPTGIARIAAHESSYEGWCTQELAWRFSWLIVSTMSGSEHAQKRTTSRVRGFFASSGHVRGLRETAQRLAHRHAIMDDEPRDLSPVRVGEWGVLPAASYLQGEQISPLYFSYLLCSVGYHTNNAIDS